jgi:hypothetical protein
MATLTRETAAPPVATARPHLHRLAAGVAAVIAVAYGLIWAGVLSVGRAESGDLGILGVAGGVFLVIAAALWFVRSRLLWIGVVLLQVLMGVMYVAIAPERDPGFEVWGITVRLLSLVLAGLLVAAMVRARRRPAS